MSLGELVLVAIRSGVITQPEIDWLLARQDGLSRAEQAAAQRLGRLLDAGSINLGCRVSARRLHHRQVLQDWMEPLGRRRQGRLPSISAGWGLNNTSYSGDVEREGLVSTSQSWSVGLQWQDAFIRGNTLGRSFAVTPERRELLWGEMDRCLALADRLATSGMDLQPGTPLSAVRTEAGPGAIGEA